MNRAAPNGLARAAIRGALLALGVATGACTQATPESEVSGGGASGGPTVTGGGSGAIASGGTPSTGSGGATSTGGSISSGGLISSGGSTAGQTGGITGSGGSSDGGGGTGTGGAVGAGGAPETGGSPASGGTTGGTDGATGGSLGAMGGSAGETATGGSAGEPPVVGCDWENPDGRIVLFDGANMDQWRNLKTAGPCQWKLIGDGSMEVVPLEPPTDIQTVMTFEDLCVHVEYMTPTYPSSVTGQDRGNSGVYLKRAYEMQILDSIGQPPAIDTCGAVYSISAPLVVACNMELVWNTYEIEFKSSVWNGNQKTQNAVFVEAKLNGQVVQRNVDLNPAGGFTQAGQPDAPGPQPLMLQDHRNLVRFRNIWVKVPHYQ